MSRPLRYLLTGIAVLAGMAGVTIAALAPRAAPYIKNRIVRDLTERFHGRVELGDVRVSAFPHLRIAGENLAVWREEEAAGPPFLRVNEFEVRASLLGLLRGPLKVGTVRVSGLSITMPPRGKRPKPHDSANAPGASSKALFLIGKILCEDTRLEMQTDKPGKQPLVFEIHSITLDSAGAERAMPFVATLTNAKPVGEIETKGEFGPWETGEPRDTPVSGTYSFDNADLATIRGIGGILSSRGSYRGVLDKIEVRGTTDTPDFTVSTGGHPMPLHTDFSATVDGTDGNTYLHPVNATLGNSVILASGSVVGEAGGHRVILDVISNDSQIQDLLKVAVKTDPPALSGAARMKTKFLLPPGPEKVSDRLHLEGEFNLPAARFPDTPSQEKVDRLSARALDRPEEVKQDNAPEILSGFHGKFKLDGGVITLSEMSFKIPGASLNLSGDYDLNDREFSFEGEAHAEAKLSHLTTGAKSFFLKMLDPLFERNGAGTTLPVRISGTGTSPHIALDLGHPRRASRQ